MSLQKEYRLLFDLSKTYTATLALRWEHLKSDMVLGNVHQVSAHSYKWLRRLWLSLQGEGAPLADDLEWIRPIGCMGSSSRSSPVLRSIRPGSLRKILGSLARSDGSGINGREIIDGPIERSVD